jgi:urease accessory protein
LSKPYWTGDVLLVQAVNATAGIFAGDELDFRVGLEPSSSVLLTSPSASRIYTMPTGEATLKQHITVNSGAWLEWMPELFIPQRDCRYRQLTTLDVARGGGLYFVETLAPGRVAHGETFAFDQLQWSTRIRYDGALVLSENYRMSPHDQSLRDLKTGGQAFYFANAVMIHAAELPVREWQKEVSDWQTGERKIGATQLAPHVYLFRLLASHSEILKSTLQELRGLLAKHIPALTASARKL